MLPPAPTHQNRSIIAHGNNNIDAGGGGGAVYRLLQAHHLQWLDSPRPSYCIRKTSCLSICKAPPWATPVLPLTGLGSRLTDKQGLKGLFKAAKKRKKAASITGSTDVKLSRKVISLQLSKGCCAKEGEQTEAVASPSAQGPESLFDRCYMDGCPSGSTSSPLHCCFSQSDRRRLGDGCLRWMTLLFDGRSTHVKASRSFSPFSPTCEGSIAATSNQLRNR